MEKFEEFCKPQANELRARFDLLTSFRHADMSVDEWYNAVKTQVALTRYPPETAQILQRNIFCFFLKDGSFVSKTLNKGHVELSRFSAKKVRQMTKKLEHSQATAKHMRQMTKDPQATQINLLSTKELNYHQISLKESSSRKTNLDPKTCGIQMKSNIKHITRKMSMKSKRNSIQDRFFKVKTDVTNVETPNI